MSEVMQQYPSAAVSVREYYGRRFDALEPEQQDALVEDVVAIMVDEDRYSRDAVQTLDRRIGNALESYVRCLVAGRNRREG